MRLQHQTTSRLRGKKGLELRNPTFFPSLCVRHTILARHRLGRRAVKFLLVHALCVGGTQRQWLQELRPAKPCQMNSEAPRGLICFCMPSSVDQPGKLQKRVCHWDQGSGKRPFVFVFCPLQCKLPWEPPSPNRNFTIKRAEAVVLLGWGVRPAAGPPITKILLSHLPSQILFPTKASKWFRPWVRRPCVWISDWENSRMRPKNACSLLLLWLMFDNVSGLPTVAKAALRPLPRHCAPQQPSPESARRP